MLQFSALRFGTEPTICDGACVTLQYNYYCLSTDEIHLCYTHTHKSSSDWLRWSKCVICSVWFAVVVNESPLSQEKIIMKDAAYWTAIFAIYCIYCDNQIWLFCTICLCVYWYIKLHDFHIELFLQDAIAGYFTITFVLWMAKFGLFCHMIYDQPLLHICITKMQLWFLLLRVLFSLSTVISIVFHFSGPLDLVLAQVSIFRCVSVVKLISCLLRMSIWPNDELLEQLQWACAKIPLEPSWIFFFVMVLEDSI